VTTTVEELLARADELRPRLVELQAETEERTYYPQEIHEAFLESRFYDVLVPKRYGGLELDLGSFWRIGMAIARGCPSTAWCLCLPAGHALQTGMLFEEEVQAELFGEFFLCPAVAAPAGSAKRVDGGWELTSTHPYSSGAPYATHYMGQTFAAPEEDGGRPGRLLLFVAPRESWTMLDDWGDTLGLRGSGSHSVRFEQAFIPERFVLENTWLVDTNVSGGTPGVRIHGNPMYAGRTLAYFEGSLAAIMIGAAKGALDEYEEILRTRKTQRPPIVTRIEDPDYQRWFGLAAGKVAAAEAVLLNIADQWHAACRRSIVDDVPFTRE
jgi:3-hydroxy-9,10-secoandrosta-1,3,5(10)-triene-9,17-dione monooxygenase